MARTSALLALLLAAALAAMASASASSSSTARTSKHSPAKLLRFSQWKSANRPEGYKTAEAESRAFEAFQETEVRVAMKNRRAQLLNSTARYTATGPFADMHPVDFQTKYLMPRRAAPSAA